MGLTRRYDRQAASRKILATIYRGYIVKLLHHFAIFSLGCWHARPFGCLWDSQDCFWHTRLTLLRLSDLSSETPARQYRTTQGNQIRIAQNNQVTSPDRNKSTPMQSNQLPPSAQLLIVFNFQRISSCRRISNKVLPLVGVSNYCYASPLRESSPDGRFDLSALYFGKPLHHRQHKIPILHYFCEDIFNLYFSRCNLDLDCRSFTRPTLLNLIVYIFYTTVELHVNASYFTHFCETPSSSRESTFRARYERSSHYHLTAIMRLPPAYQSPAYRFGILLR